MTANTGPVFNWSDMDGELDEAMFRVVSTDGLSSIQTHRASLRKGDVLEFSSGEVVLVESVDKVTVHMKRFFGDFIRWDLKVKRFRDCLGRFRNVSLSIAKNPICAGDRAWLVGNVIAVKKEDKHGD